MPAGEHELLPPFNKMSYCCLVISLPVSSSSQGGNCPRFWGSQPMEFKHVTHELLQVWVSGVRDSNQKDAPPLGAHALAGKNEEGSWVDRELCPVGSLGGVRENGKDFF